MYQINSNGYQPSTPEELKQILIEKNQKNNPDFEDLAQTLQGNLLDQSTVNLMYQELNIQRLFNFPSFSQATELLFLLMGDDRNIRRKGAYPSEVTLRFTAPLGTIIPQDFKISDSTGKVVFKTYEQVLVDTTTGIIDVLAYCKDQNLPSIGIGDLNKIVDNTPNITVTNIDVPTTPTEEESFVSFKRRVQQRFKNPKLGSFGSLIGEVEAVKGVNTRLVGYRLAQISESGTTWNAFEVVAGGGDPIDIAYAIYKAGGINGYRYLSSPSNSETQRTISQDLKIRNQTFPIKFTRPKKLELSIKVSVKFQKIEASNNSIQALTMNKMTEYVNNIPVGVSLNVISLANAFMRGLEEAGGTFLNIAQDQIEFTLKKDGSPFNKNGDGYYVTEFDEYVELTEYIVEINQ